MIRILIACPLTSKAIDRLNEIPEFEISEKNGLTPGQLLDEIRNADALVFAGVPPATGSILEAGTDLKIIINCGDAAGVDMASAQRKRIEVRGISAKKAAGTRTIAILKDFFNV